MSCLRAKTAQVLACRSRFLAIFICGGSDVSQHGAGPLRKGPAVQRGCNPFRHATDEIVPSPPHILCRPSETKRTKPNLVTFLTLPRQQVQYLQATGRRNRLQYSRLPASVLARAQSHPVLHTPPIFHTSIHPSHSLPPMLPTFSPTPRRLADLRSAPLPWHTRVTRRGRMWRRTNPSWARKFAHATNLPGRMRGWAALQCFERGHALVVQHPQSDWPRTETWFFCDPAPSGDTALSNYLC